jgi:ADP-ribose pyrophosphatase YjhB (NUDIX family)
MVEGKVQVLLLTSSATGRFAIPKGNIEEGTSARDIGAKQAFEEGGVGGTFDNDGPLGVFNYHDRDADGSISLMSIEVHVFRADEQKKDSLPKKERPLTWVSPELAAKLVWESGLAKLFLTFAEIKPAF